MIRANLLCRRSSSPVLKETQNFFLNDEAMSSSHTTIGHVLIVKLLFPSKNSGLTNGRGLLCHWRPCASTCRRNRPIGTPPSAPRRLNSCVRVICHRPHVLSRECAQYVSLSDDPPSSEFRGQRHDVTPSTVACHHGLDGKWQSIHNFEVARIHISWVLEIHATEQHAGGAGCPAFRHRPSGTSQMTPTTRGHPCDCRRTQVSKKATTLTSLSSQRHQDDKTAKPKDSTRTRVKTC